MNLSSWEIGYEPWQHSPCHLLGQRYPKAALMYIPSDILGSQNIRRSTSRCVCGDGRSGALAALAESAV